MAYIPYTYRKYPTLASNSKNKVEQNAQPNDKESKDAKVSHTITRKQINSNLVNEIPSVWSLCRSRYGRNCLHGSSWQFKRAKRASLLSTEHRKTANLPLAIQWAATKFLCNLLPYWKWSHTVLYSSFRIRNQQKKKTYEKMFMFKCLESGIIRAIAFTKNSLGVRKLYRPKTADNLRASRVSYNTLILTTHALSFPMPSAHNQCSARAPNSKLQTLSE